MSSLPSGPARPTHKLLGLEVLRLFAALVVVLWHYQHFAFVGEFAAPSFSRSYEPFYRLLWPFYEYGYLGVEVFWCISGYIFFWKYSTRIADGSVGAWQFLVLRFSRLYPLHLATLLLVAALQGACFLRNGWFLVYQKNDLPHFLLQLPMASNWLLRSGYGFNGPIWSISLEVVVYFLFFVGIRLFGPSLLLSAGMIAVCGVAKYVNNVEPIFLCIAFFYAGGIAASVGRWPAVQAGRRLFAFLAVAFLVAAPVAVVALKLWAHNPFRLLFLLAYVPVLLFFLTEYFKPGAASARWIEVGGNLTYASYLSQFPIQLILVLGFSLAGRKIPMGHPAFFLFFVGTVFLVAFFVYRYFEAPAMKWIRDRARALRGSTHTGSK